MAVLYQNSIVTSNKELKSKVFLWEVENGDVIQGYINNVEILTTASYTLINKGFEYDDHSLAHSETIYGIDTPVQITMFIVRFDIDESTHISNRDIRTLLLTLIVDPDMVDVYYKDIDTRFAKGDSKVAADKYILGGEDIYEILPDPDIMVDEYIEIAFQPSALNRINIIFGG